MHIIERFMNSSMRNVGCYSLMFTALLFHLIFHASPFIFLLTIFFILFLFIHPPQSKVAKDSGVPDRNYAAHTLCKLLTQHRAYAEEAEEWQKQQLAALLKAAFLTPRNEEREGDAIKDAFFR